MATWAAAMRAGRYADAWALAAKTLAERDPATRDDPALPYHLRWVWDGSAVDGRHVLVRCYHGLGDTIQFARFLPLLAARAASVTVEVQPRLLELIATVSDAITPVPFDVAHPLPPARSTSRSPSSTSRFARRRGSRRRPTSMPPRRCCRAERSRSATAPAIGTVPVRCPRACSRRFAARRRRHADARADRSRRAEPRRLSVRHRRDRGAGRGRGPRRHGRHDDRASGRRAGQADVADAQGRTRLALGARPAATAPGIPRCASTPRRAGRLEPGAGRDRARPCGARRPPAERAL